MTTAVVAALLIAALCAVGIARIRGASTTQTTVSSLVLLIVPLVMVLCAPIPGGAWGVIWILLAIVLALSSVAMAVDFPDNNVGDWLHGKVWGTDPNKAVPARWVQAISAGTLFGITLLFWIGVGIASLFGTATVPDGALPTNTTPSVSPVMPTSSAPSIEVPTVCKTPTLIEIEPSKVRESNFNPTPETGVQRCVGAKWVEWSGEAPAKITVTKIAEGKWTFYVFKYKDAEVLIRFPPQN